jgi:hypothetical protein
MQESAELFFDAPGRRQLLGGVVDGEDVIEAGPGPGGQRVVSAEQQGSVRPGRVDLAPRRCSRSRISRCRTLDTVRFARPESITAASTLVLSRVVQRARAGS